MAYYTLDQQRKAQQAIQLHQALRHPSDKALSAMLSGNSTLNSEISAVDLANARAIYGPCPHCLEGKPYPHEGSHETFDPGGEPQKPGELLHVDIVYIDGRPRLFSVDHVTGYISIIIMESKSRKSVEKAYEQLINSYLANSKVVKMISSDHEATLKSCESYLGSRGVKTALRIPYEHEKVAERSVRMLREKMETTRRELPYDLPTELFDALAVEVARCCNAVPNAKTVPYSPNEMITDQKFNFLTDVQVPFGMPVLVNSAGAQYAGSVPKQEIAICLGSASNTKGGIWVYVPNRKQALVRRGLKPMPMTADIIDFMNDWARRKPGKDREIMISFDETPTYSEDSEELSSRKQQDLKDQLKRVDDFHLMDRVLDADHEAKQPTPTTILNPEVPDDLKLQWSSPTRQSPNKRLLEDESKGGEYQSSGKTRVDRDLKSPIRDTSHETSSYKVLRSIPSNNKSIETSDNTDLPRERLESSLDESTSDDYSKHLDSGTTNERYPKRDRAPPNRMNLNIRGLLFMASYLKDQDEKDIEGIAYAFATSGTMSMAQAMKSSYSEQADEAAIIELKQLVSLKSWRYLKSVKDASPSIHKNVTPCSMFLKPKQDSEGTFLLWRARLVGGGHRTDPDVYDNFEKHSPTVPIEVAMLQLGIAAKQNGSIEVFDIPCAYLNASLDKDKQQMMRFPKEIAKLLVRADPEAKKFLQEDGTILVQVLRALYGFPESARLWYEYLSAALRSAGYTVSPSEPCLFRKFETRNGRREWSMLSIYVDDCLHTFNNERQKLELYRKLAEAKIPKPKIQTLNLQQSISYLGINIKMEEPGVILASQPGYIRQILDEFQPKKKYPTPCQEDIFKRPVEELEGDTVAVTDYLSKLMKLMFLATRTRPDLLLSLSVLSTKARSPNVHDMARLDRVIGYLWTTENLGLRIKIKSLKLYAYFDASWACHSDLKGHTGIIVTLGFNGLPLMCKSKKQKVVSRSSTEAELIAMFEGLDYLLYLRRLVQFLGCLNDDDPPITIYQDNTSAMTLAYLGKTSSGSNSKFMELKYFWIKDYLDRRMFKLEYLPTDAMIADFFASPRIGATFRSMRDTILGYEA